MLHNPFRHWLTVLLVAGIALTLVDFAHAAPEAARVVGIRGSVLANSPGEEPRLLRFDEAIYSGDKIVTAGGAGVGLLSGEHYVGLDESTTAVVGLTEDGAPDVRVLKGRARLLASSADGIAARIGTDGLLADNAGTDTDVFAFAEKAGLVTMICPNEGSVGAARGAEGLEPGSGKCAVAKRGEPIYLADAAHPPLDLLADTGGYDIAGDPTERIGGPLPPVALGMAPSPIFASSADPIIDDPRAPCDSPALCSSERPPTVQMDPPRVMRPPVNPVRPGSLPQ